jgi:hypothetical protein
MNDKICIVRPTYYDRSAMLQLSLEHQKNAENSENFQTYIFVDPHSKYGYSADYDNVITEEYIRINWSKNSGKYSWYDSVKYIFDNTDYEYVLSIEDDVLISRDYLRMCVQLSEDKVVSKYDNILYFHIGAWEKPKGNPNKIIRSSASIRSCLINRFKFFRYIKKYYDILKKNKIHGLDLDIKNILVNNKMTAIAPEVNRHAHIGVYGWSAMQIQADSKGQKSLFDKPLCHEEMYYLLKESCLSGSRLLELNQNKNPNYFWDFDPNINFNKLEYCL